MTSPGWGGAMEWTAWSPTMAAIRKEFGYEAEPDREAAHALLKLVPPTNRFRDLGVEVRNRRDLVIAGCGPGLDKAKADVFVGKAVVAADGATERLQELGIVPRLVVTDLDGKPDALRWAGAQGSRMVVHAHGDNRKALADLVPSLGPQVYGTHQLDPQPGLEPLRNVGGFTDGDRAVLLCEALGAGRPAGRLRDGPAAIEVLPFLGPQDEAAETGVGRQDHRGLPSPRPPCPDEVRPLGGP